MMRTVAVALAISVGLLATSLDAPSHAASAKVKGKFPDLKILSVEATPMPFFLNEHPLTLTITVALPKSVPGDALLDVSTLITSPSKTSFRLLTNRQAVANDAAAGADGAKSIPLQVQVMQPRHPAEAAPVTAARRHGDHRLTEHPPHDARQGPAHAGDHDQHLRPPQELVATQQPVQPRHADVVERRYAVAQHLRRHARLLGH